MLRRATLATAIFTLTGCAGDRSLRSDRNDGSPADRERIASTLDQLHRAAATADEDVYFALFAPEAVFLGTDATERWPLSEFRSFAMPYFQRDSAWVYEPLERHIDLAPEGGFAWFDERLHNARLGETRGSGALRKIDGRWRIVQYNLTIPVPNDLADDVAAMIREHEASRPD